METKVVMRTKEEVAKLKKIEKKEKREFLKSLEGKLTTAQLLVVEDGLKSFLSLEKVKFYANPKFDSSQMHAIKEAFYECLDFEKVEVIANTDLSYMQMNELKECFLRGLSIEQVKVIANSKFTPSQMYALRECFMLKLTIEQVKEIANPNFTTEQMYKACKLFQLKNIENNKKKRVRKSPILYLKQRLNEKKEALKDRLTEEQINVFSKTEFAPSQMKALRKCFSVGKLTIEQVKEIANPIFTAGQMYEACKRIVLQQNTK